MATQSGVFVVRKEKYEIDIIKNRAGVVKNVWDMIGKRMVEGGYPTMAGEQMNLFLNFHTDCI